MKITSIIWLPKVIEKLEVKHGVTVEEVEEVFELGAAYRRGPRGQYSGRWVKTMSLGWRKF